MALILLTIQPIQNLNIFFQKYILSNINLLLAPNAQHCEVFPEVPSAGFKSGKSLKDLLVMAKVPMKKVIVVVGKRCKVCFSKKKKTLLLTKGVMIVIR